MQDDLQSWRSARKCDRARISLQLRNQHGRQRSLHRIHVDRRSKCSPSRDTHRSEQDGKKRWITSDTSRPSDHPEPIRRTLQNPSKRLPHLLPIPLLPRFELDVHVAVQLLQWIPIHAEGKGSQLAAVLDGEHRWSWIFRISDRFEEIQEDSKGVGCFRIRNGSGHGSMGSFLPLPKVSSALW